MAVRANVRGDGDRAVSRGNQGHRSGAASHTEAQLHRAVAGFLNARLQPPDFFSTFPAGGGGLMRGRLLKAMGLKTGMPDIFPLIINGIVYGAELKTVKGVVSDTQKETHAALLATGAVRNIAIWRSMYDMKLFLSVWRAKLRSVTPLAERLHMSIESWNSSYEKNSDQRNLGVDSFPISDQIGRRRIRSSAVGE